MDPIEISWSLVVEMVWLLDKWEVRAQPECRAQGAWESSLAGWLDVVYGAVFSQVLTTPACVISLIHTQPFLRVTFPSGWGIEAQRG